MQAILVATLFTILSWLSVGGNATPPATDVCGVISTNTVWTASASPYIATCGISVTSGVTLTLEAGVVVAFDTGMQLVVNSGGTLIAQGTALQPIRFTAHSDVPQAGDWGNLYISPDATAQISNCEIRNAGRNGVAALRIDATHVQVQHCQIHHNQGDGIELFAANIQPLLEDIQLEQNGGKAIHQFTADMSPIYHRINVTGNAQDAIVIDGGTIVADRSWQFGDAHAPIHIASSITVIPGRYLALEPGTELRFGNNTSLLVLGGLYALGIPSRPITLTAQTQQPGSWSGVDISAGASAILRYCDLGYGGQNLSPLLRSSGNHLVVQHCHIHHSSNDGVQIAMFAPPALTQNRIEENVFGLRNALALTEVEATHNWWGAATGPFHPTLNAAGQGNAVSDGVRFVPWLQSATLTPTVTPEIFLQIIGPGAASPGEIVDYRVAYANNGETAIENAVLSVLLAGATTYMENSADGLYWPERHEVFWKLGRLEAGASGLTTVRARLRWGLPFGVVDTTLVRLGGAWSGSAFDITPYLAYTPIRLASRIQLSAEQVAAERQADSKFDALYGQALSHAYQLRDASQLRLTSGLVYTQALFSNFAQGEFQFVQRRQDQAQTLIFGRDHYAVRDPTGGLTITLQLPQPQIWGSWAAANADTGRWAHTLTEATMGQCMYNCMNGNVLDWTFGQVTSQIDNIASSAACAACAASHGDDSENCQTCAGFLVDQLPGVEKGSAIYSCYDDCRNNPNEHVCQQDQISCEYDTVTTFLGYFGVDSYVRYRCDPGSGQYRKEVYYCDSGERCKPGVGCTRCTDSSEESEGDGGGDFAVNVQGTAPALWSWLTEDGESCRSDPMTIRPARDPNAKYGFLGEVTPGQRISYTIAYENVGAGNAYGVYITDHLSEHFEASTLQIGSDGKYIASAQLLLWEIGELSAQGQPGAAGTITFTAKLKNNLLSNTVVTNQALVYFPSVPETTPTNPVINIVQPLAAVPQMLQTNSGQPLPITLQGIDAANRSLQYHLVTQPGNGVLSGAPPNLVYTPSPNFVGPDRFSFTVSNSISESHHAEIFIQVLPATTDGSAPNVLWTIPAAGGYMSPIAATAIITSGAGVIYPPVIIIKFSKPLDAATVTTTTVQIATSTGQPLAAHILYLAGSQQIRLWLRQPLQTGQIYTVVVKAAIKDLRGNSLTSDYRWQFNTGAVNASLYLPLIRH